jgi:hypothetical protein
VRGLRPPPGRLSRQLGRPLPSRPRRTSRPAGWARGVDVAVIEGAMIPVTEQLLEAVSAAVVTFLDGLADR